MEDALWFWIGAGLSMPRGYIKQRINRDGQLPVHEMISASTPLASKTRRLYPVGLDAASPTRLDYWL